MGKMQRWRRRAILSGLRICRRQSCLWGPPVLVGTANDGLMPMLILIRAWHPRYRLKIQGVGTFLFGGLPGFAQSLLPLAQPFLKVGHFCAGGTSTLASGFSSALGCDVGAGDGLDGAVVALGLALALAPAGDGAGDAPSSPSCTLSTGAVATEDGTKPVARAGGSGFLGSIGRARVSLGTIAAGGFCTPHLFGFWSFWSFWSSGGGG
jgi:hypothetical protein